MDIREAIRWIEELEEYCEDVFSPLDVEASEYIAAALKELDEYRKIGTIEELRGRKRKDGKP